MDYESSTDSLDSTDSIDYFGENNGCLRAYLQTIFGRSDASMVAVSYLAAPFVSKHFSIEAFHRLFRSLLRLAVDLLNPDLSAPQRRGTGCYGDSCEKTRAG